MSQVASEEARALGKRITELREERGWTQRQLAEAAGTSTTFLSEVENGKRNLSSGKLLRIADELGTSMDYLAKGIHAAPRPRPDISIPPELSDAAEEQGWSFAQATALIQTRELIRERRSPSGADAGRAYSKEDWIELYQKLFE